MDIFSKYKTDRIPRELLYVLGRVGLFVAANVFSVMMSVMLCSLISSVLGIIFGNSNRFVSLSLVPFLNNATTVSVVGYIILMGIMFRIFWDDGKRHTAYGKFSMPISLAAVFFMFAVYFIPSIFLTDAKDSIIAAIRLFYRPAMWLSGAFDGNIQMSVVISAGVLCVLCMVVYKLSGDRYLKKYADVYKEN